MIYSIAVEISMSIILKDLQKDIHILLSADKLEIQLNPIT